MGELVDWDEIHRNIAVDQFVGHVDGYSMNTNNYRVYFDPSDGKMDMLAWDLDYAFYRDVDWGMSWQNANGNLTNACLANAECRSAQRAAVRRLVAVYEAEDMEAWYDGLESLTYAATQADPRRECGAGDVQTYRNYIRDWLRAEPAYLRGWWGL
jgi:hypothetical protein